MSEETGWVRATRWGAVGCSRVWDGPLESGCWLWLG